MDGRRRSARILGPRKLRSRPPRPSASPATVTAVKKKKVQHSASTPVAKRKHTQIASTSTPPSAAKGRLKKKKVEVKKAKKKAKKKRPPSTQAVLADKLIPQLEKFLDELCATKHKGQKPFKRVLHKTMLRAKCTRWFALRKDLKKRSKHPQTVVLHHNTDLSPSIQKHGLLTPQDRYQKSIYVYNGGGTCYGKGIYCGNSPFDFCNYGEKVITCVAQLGDTTRVVSQDSLLHYKHPGSQTVIGNKGHDAPPYTPTANRDEVVMRKSAQVLSVFSVDRWTIRDSTFVDEGGINRGILAAGKLDSIISKFLKEEDPDWDAPAAPYDQHQYNKLPKAKAGM